MLPFVANWLYIIILETISTQLDLHFLKCTYYCYHIQTNNKGQVILAIENEASHINDGKFIKS